MHTQAKASTDVSRSQDLDSWPWEFFPGEKQSQNFVPRSLRAAASVLGGNLRGHGREEFWCDGEAGIFRGSGGSPGGMCSMPVRPITEIPPSPIQKNKKRLHVHQCEHAAPLNSCKANFVKSSSSGCINHSQTGIQRYQANMQQMSEIESDRHFKNTLVLLVSLRRPKWRRSCPRKTGGRRRCSHLKMTSVSC